MLNLNILECSLYGYQPTGTISVYEHFLIGPVRSILDERKQMIEHDLDEAKNRETEARQMKEQYQASIGNADEEAQESSRKPGTGLPQSTRRFWPRPGQTLPKRWKRQTVPLPWSARKPMNDLRPAWPVWP